MTQDTGNDQLSEDRRKEIFLALVDAQDHEMDVGQSRKLMIQRFGVNERQVRQIEREGLECQWPPLGEKGTVQSKRIPSNDSSISDRAAYPVGAGTGRVSCSSPQWTASGFVSRSVRRKSQP